MRVPPAEVDVLIVGRKLLEVMAEPTQVAVVEVVRTTTPITRVAMAVQALS